MREHQNTVEAHMEFVEKELRLFKDEFTNVRTGQQDNTDYLRDTKHDLKEEMVRIEKYLDRVEDDITVFKDELRAEVGAEQNDKAIKEAIKSLSTTETTSESLLTILIKDMMIKLVDLMVL